ncbi:MAG: hypothetical protein JWP91_4201, partial [Fibrobacteres bacterium]|nr:hypothetical protein [Fibrobacterota bacterium]
MAAEAAPVVDGGYSGVAGEAGGFGRWRQSDTGYVKDTTGAPGRARSVVSPIDPPVVKPEPESAKAAGARPDSNAP